LWLARHLRLEAPALPVILASSDAALPASASLAANVASCLVKPVEAGDLLHALAAALPPGTAPSMPATTGG
jgi:CheY-like chemotaxis protein